MAKLCTPNAPTHAKRLNVADRLSAMAAQLPDGIAVACQGRTYDTVTFAELDADVTRIALGLASWGVPPGTRLALLVRPGIDFVTLVFALLRAGMVAVLIDPGLGRRNMIRCLAEAEPEGFVAIPLAHAVRQLLRHRFPRARWNVTVGRRWLWSGMTLDQLRNSDCGLRINSDNPKSEMRNPKSTAADSPAAIIFTSGSTGAPKGVLYTHGMFDTQVREIQTMYSIEPGGVDLSCFPLFALFNSAMGVTTVFPNMDFSRPASADPKRLFAAANDWQATQAFASPAVWRVVSTHCTKTGERIPSLRQVFSCGAPVTAEVLRATLACVADDARMHTPYGATECLPVSTIEADEVLGQTEAKTDEGAGVCVGRKFDSIDWRIIRITDDPIATMNDAEVLPVGEIGELIVRGPQISPRYVTRPEANASSKIADGERLWHRLGDVGYLDADGRFWYCGRKSQRVETSQGPLFTECVEAVFNTHPAVRRSALVGVGLRGGQTPALVVELESRQINPNWQDELRRFGRAHKRTGSIRHFLAKSPLPVDIRHNAKINREQLAAWAAKQLMERS